jgi:hypothetical protein
MTEHLFKFLASLFRAGYVFFSRRASALELERVTLTYVGRHVRVTCGQKHYGCVLDGTWLVSGYDDCCGDLKVAKVGGVGDGIAVRNWVKPECVEVVS